MFKTLGKTSHGIWTINRLKTVAYFGTGGILAGYWYTISQMVVHVNRLIIRSLKRNYTPVTVMTYNKRKTKQ